MNLPVLSMSAGHSRASCETWRGLNANHQKPALDQSEALISAILAGEKEEEGILIRIILFERSGPFFFHRNGLVDCLGGLSCWFSMDTAKKGAASNRHTPILAMSIFWDEMVSCHVPRFSKIPRITGPYVLDAFARKKIIPPL